MRTIEYFLVICLMLAAPLSGAAVQVTLDGEPGEPLTQGYPYYFDSSNARISVTHDAGEALRISVYRSANDLFSLNFEAPAGQQLAATTYARVTRQRAVNRAGMNVSGNGQFCAASAGMFEILELELGDDSQLDRLALDFRQRCAGQEEDLFGHVRLNSSLPVDRSRPFAVAGRDKGGFEDERILLNGSDSFVRDAQLVSYRWRQRAGPPARLIGAHKPRARFWPRDLPLGGATFEFELTVTDNRGLKDRDAVAVTVPSKSDPQFFISLDSDSSELIGLGRKWRLTPHDGVLSLAADDAGGLAVRYRGSQPNATLNFSPPQGARLAPALYDYATAFSADAQPGLPGINVRLAGRRCPDAIGRFRLLSLEDRAGAPHPDAVAVDFRQRCFPGGPELTGKLRYNAVPLEVPVARVSPELAAAPGSMVTLDGSASRDHQQDRLSYRWRQLSGRPVQLQQNEGPLARFVMPDYEADTTPMDRYLFELIVEDEKGYKSVAETEVSRVSET